MSVLAMPTLNGWGKKAVNIAAIIGLIAMLAAYLNGFLSNYALASDLKAHIVQSDTRYHTTMRRELKQRIKRIENDLALYGLDRSSRALTPREKMHETQLVNMKAEYLRDLRDFNPR